MAQLLSRGVGLCAVDWGTGFKITTVTFPLATELWNLGGGRVLFIQALPSPSMPTAL